MKTRHEGFTLTINKKDGTPAISENGQVLLTTDSGASIWIPKQSLSSLDKVVTFHEHEKGDTFVANRDSTRTKGNVLGDSCPEGKEDEPLYSAGDTVTRQSRSFEFVGFRSEVPAMGFEEKLRIMQAMGITPSISM